MSSEETLGEYVKALVKVDRLDSSSLMQTLQVGSCSCVCYGGLVQCPVILLSAHRGNVAVAHLLCSYNAGVIFDFAADSCLRRT